MNGSRGVAMDYHLVELRLIHIQPLYNNACHPAPWGAMNVAPTTGRRCARLVHKNATHPTSLSLLTFIHQYSNILMSILPFLFVSPSKCPV
jgi:hypothetical protein